MKETPPIGLRAVCLFTVSAPDFWTQVRRWFIAHSEHPRWRCERRDETLSSHSHRKKDVQGHGNRCAREVQATMSRLCHWSTKGGWLLLLLGKPHTNYLSRSG